MTPLAPIAVTASSYYRNEGKVSDAYHPMRTAEARKVYGGWISDIADSTQARWL